MKRSDRILLVTFMVWGLSLPRMAISEEAKQKQIIKKSITKELQGEITWVKKDKISIVYSTDETGKTDNEILLPVGGDVKLTHIQSMKQLAIGDVVSIQFEEVTKETSEGEKTDRKVKAITFIKRNVKKPIEVSEPSQVLGGE